MDMDLRRRRRLRLAAYDYSMPGAYFVTICTYARECSLGHVVDGALRLTCAGGIVEQSWQWLSTRYPYVTLDAFVLMPNHLHGILFLDPPGSQSPALPRKPLGRLVAAFKTLSAHRINSISATPVRPMWQRSYYEHVVRDDSSLDRIRDYIACNPQQWTLDPENPESTPRGTAAPDSEDPPPWMV
ncbi:MAG: transposase [Dehalococcoidia bacterium]|jgi:REP element-mobilizing transposase RayT|nr:transposase [Dehalococcoidia bacterium]